METRKILVELIFDLDQWEDYEDVSDELMLEDSGIFNVLMNGVRVNLIEPDQSDNNDRPTSQPSLPSL